MRRSVAARRRKGQEKRGWFYIALAAVAFAAIGGGALYMSLTERKTDRTTGCPVDGYDKVTAVLVDMTDTLSPLQAASLQNALLKIRDGVQKFSRLEIYSLGSVAKSTLNPVFAACSPGSGRDVDNRLYANPELADKLWKRQFGDHVEAVVAEVQKLAPQENSPILEGIKSVSVTAFGTPAAQQSKKTLIVISDLIQHGPEMSMYRGAPEFTKFRETPFFVKTRPGLHGADVELVVVERETKNNVQNARWQKFWLDYFAGLNARVQRWVKIEDY